MDMDMDGGKAGKKLEKETKDEIYKRAQKYQIKGRSSMNKAQLVAAVRAKYKEVGDKLGKRRK